MEALFSMDEMIADEYKIFKPLQFRNISFMKEDEALWISQAIPVFEGKHAFAHAKGAPAEILHAITGEEKVYGLKESAVGEFSTQGGIICLKEGDILLERTIYGFETRNISSVRRVNELKNLEAFAEMEEGFRLVFKAKIVDVAKPYFYEGCVDFGCNQKKVFANADGYRCPKCEETYPEALPSVAATVTLEENGETVQATLFSKEFLEAAGVGTVEELKKMDVDEIKQLLLGKTFVFVVKTNIFEKGFDSIPEYHITLAVGI